MVFSDQYSSGDDRHTNEEPIIFRARLENEDESFRVIVDGARVKGQWLQPPKARKLLLKKGGGESLENLTNRKQQIINHLQEEPMFMGNGASLYLADSQKGFDGLKTVLSTTKQRREAMPKSVSDMFVATRSTQSLDELLNDDIQNYTVKWSEGDDLLSDVTSVGEFLETSMRRSLPESCTTNSVSFSMASTTVPNIAVNSRSSVEGSTGNADVNTTQSGCSSDAEFCRFPNDDSDETIIPFEHTSVSRFGPISRMSKAKMYNSAPVQVTADSYKWMTPVLSVTPLDRPLATTMQMPTRFPCRGKAEMLKTEPSVKPTPLEIPSIWQQTPLPSYHNIARMKAGAAEAVTNNERLAYELQAVELEIAMKTGKEPESFTKIIQDAGMAPSQAQSLYRPSSDLTTSKSIGSFVPPMSQEHFPDIIMNVEASERLLIHNFTGDYNRSWPGIKK